MPISSTSSSLALSNEATVSTLLTEAPDPFACLVLAHGAGAGMHHPFMTAVANGLAERNITTLRYQFPYMEAGSKRVDSPSVSHAAVRAAVDAVAGPVPLFAGGKSFGARMTSQAQALLPLPGVIGLVFFGFPLHPAGRPSIDRAHHLSGIQIPTLFLHGARDALADSGLLAGVTDGLGAKTTVITIADADHSFHVPLRSGRKDAQVLQDTLDGTVNWMRRVIGR